MKTMGLIGGMSWESSIEYYRIINQVVKTRLGGLHSARCLLYSVDFAEIEPLQHAGQWDLAAQKMVEAAQALCSAGADFLVLCTNTMHKTADEIERRAKIPLLHIADATASQIKAAGCARVGLLGTGFTMEDDFYKGRLIDRHSLDVLVPPPEEREVVHKVIYDELCLGDIRESSRQRYVAIMDGLLARGAEGIILGCTEIGLLIRPGDCRAPIFDTTRIHAEAAVDLALPE